ncbi:hypothetical protein [Rhizobium leguminosarum]|uniref:hypothetical protein n=1 Tax=Rhizobium leguminosarum TaxID=384 RepID=UPI00143FB666|nr:hypothetical protein [Rhizobium leguminosarum]MCA2406426.1 hypothetical protein [Rhizobium leguminosarum]NKM59891.1 hypothetical protein [Rhizobium leguminosarum bv. viciae]
MDTARDAAHRGLLKLMLRLPSLRGELQLLWPSDPSFEALCEAYQDATATLERLVQRPGDGEDGLVEEYRGVCQALESDVVLRCRSRMARARPDRHS